MKKRKTELNNYLGAICDENRLAILSILKDGPLCVCQIFSELNMPQNLTSHHLKVLKNCGLIESQRKGTKILYSRKKSNIENCHNLLTKIIT